MDEAHELEASLTQAMSYRFQPYELAGTVRRLIKAVRNSFGFLKRHFDEDFLRRLWTKLKEATASLDKQITELVKVTGSSESGNRTTFTGRELDVIISMLVAISDTLQTHVYIGTQTMQMLDDVEERNEKIDGLEAEVSRILTETRERMKQIAESLLLRSRGCL